MAHLFSARTSDEKELSNTANQKPRRYGIDDGPPELPRDRPILEKNSLLQFSFFSCSQELQSVALGYMNANFRNLGYMNANFRKMAQETIINLHQNL
jgi:hypothetical protein